MKIFLYIFCRFKKIFKDVFKSVLNNGLTFSPKLTKLNGTYAFKCTHYSLLDSFVCLFVCWKIMSENSAPKLGVKMAIHGIIFSLSNQCLYLFYLIKNYIYSNFQ